MLDISSKNAKVYISTMNAFWNYTHGTDRPSKFADYSEDDLLSINPKQIVEYCSFGVYGVPNPLDNDKPTKGRSSWIEFQKKALSFSMPNRLAHWDAWPKSGNPTKSVELNNLIKNVKKKEVRKQGKESQARRPLEMTELRTIVRRCLRDEQPFIKSTATAFFLFQLHLIARLDDVAMFLTEDITPHSQFDFCPKSKMCWSKNVLEERDAPDQIILGSVDPNFCVLLSLAVHLEYSIGAGLVSRETTLFGVSKSRISKLLSTLLSENIFFLQLLEKFEHIHFVSLQVRKILLLLILIIKLLFFLS